MCQHQPPCPPANASDREAAHVMASHPEQGWSLLCNGVVVFEDTGALLPDGRSIPPHQPARLKVTARLPRLSRLPRLPQPVTACAVAAAGASGRTRNCGPGYVVAPGEVGLPAGPVAVVRRATSSVRDRAPVLRKRDSTCFSTVRGDR